MPRQRERLQSKQEGNFFFTRFRHPIRQRVVCVNLGNEHEQAQNLAALNRIWLDPAQWMNPTVDNSRVRSSWLGPDEVVKLLGAKKVVSQDRAPDAIDQGVWLIEKKAMQAEIDRQRGIIERQAAELTHWRGKKIHSGPYATLAEAKAAFKSKYTGKDPSATENILWDLQRFVDKFGEATRVDTLLGREGEISGWLHGLKNGKGKTLSPSRRMQMLWYILRMVRESNITLDTTKIDRISRKKIKESRRKIKYLPKPDAEKLAAVLPPYWQSVFKIQATLGLRPEEIPTLHRDNFNGELSELDLAPQEHLTLKTGWRKIPIPAEIRSTIQARLALNDILFPQKAKSKKSKNPGKRVDRLWDDPKMFDRQYVKALRAGAKSIGISESSIDARVGRRCCASWMLQANIGADRIAALLGNTAQQIIDSYGDPDTSKLPLGATTFI